MTPENKKLVCYALIAALGLGLLYLYYKPSSCGCGAVERMGPKYKDLKKPSERFTQARAYEQGPYVERFSNDFKYNEPVESLQKTATATSPFIGSL